LAGRALKLARATRKTRAREAAAARLHSGGGGAPVEDTDSDEADDAGDEDNAPRVEEAPGAEKGEWGAGFICPLCKIQFPAADALQVGNVLAAGCHVICQRCSALRTSEKTTVRAC
jgi:hypothetical protein